MSLYHETLSPSSNDWMMFELDENGITSFEVWTYVWYSQPNALTMAGCLLRRFHGTEDQWKWFIRDWYWLQYKRRNPYGCTGEKI